MTMKKLRVAALAALVALLAYVAWSWVNAGKTGDGAGGLVELFRKKQTEMAFRAVTSFVAKQAPVRKFEREHFAEGDENPGRVKFLLCLDKTMLPVMRDTVRVGSAARRAAWVETYRDRLQQYRTQMSPAECERLRAALATPEGQHLVQDSARFFYRDLSAADKVILQPIITEVAAILSEHGTAPR